MADLRAVQMVAKKADNLVELTVGYSAEVKVAWKAGLSAEHSDARKVVRLVVPMVVAMVAQKDAQLAVNLVESSAALTAEKMAALTVVWWVGNLASCWAVTLVFVMVV